MMALKPCDMKRLLVVDDDATFRRLYAAIAEFEFPGIEIDTAVNGAEALERFEEEHHGVVVMDLRMPIMDGMTAFFEIRQKCEKKKWAMPAVVFCSAFLPPEPLKAVIGDGTPRCLIKKPMTEAELVDAVRARLGSGK
jgi:CheY-like chemotaxis protein